MFTALLVIFTFLGSHLVVCETSQFDRYQWRLPWVASSNRQDKTKESGDWERVRHEWFTMYLSSEAAMVLGDQLATLNW